MAHAPVHPGGVRREPRADDLKGVEHGARDGAGEAGGGQRLHGAKLLRTHRRRGGDGAAAARAAAEAARAGPDAAAGPRAERVFQCVKGEEVEGLLRR